jgi:uncharacterized repeat protein (TIGR01451 family)
MRVRIVVAGFLILGFVATRVEAQIAADLGVTKADSPDPVVAGDDLTYSLTLTNAGPDAAAAVILSDNLPAGTTFVSAIQNSGPAFTLTTPAVGGTGNVTATIATFSDGATAAFTLVVNVNPATAGGTTITNTATIASTTTEPNAANNTDTETTAVLGAVPALSGRQTLALFAAMLVMLLAVLRSKRPDRSVRT